MMRVGLLSDLHADLPAFRRALFVLTQHDADQILCAGDLVERGPDGDAVVALLRQMRIPAVQGNHDFDAIGNQDWLQANAELGHPALKGRLLNAETLDFLKSLPLRLEFTWEGRRLLLAHGAPWSNIQYVFPTNPEALFRRVVAAAQSDVVILGHTHVPMCIQVDGVRIINPGAVSGYHPDGRGSCAMLTLPDCAVQIFDLQDGSIREEYV